MKSFLSRAAARLADPILAKQTAVLEQLQVALGAHEARLLKDKSVTNIQQAEFRVFSQFGEDGIIQYLTNNVAIDRDFFVEVGVGDYSESNTRFLLIHNNWSGAIFDVARDHIRFLERSELSWRHSIKGYSVRLTRENVNDVLATADATGDLGLLSIDVDGNDYWLWDAMTVASPRILVVEYNSLFGWRLPLTIPYRDNFDRHAAHSSNLYFGASLAALAHLASTRGYRLVGSNSVGSNAFFVRQDVAGHLPALTTEEAYVKSRFRQGRNEARGLAYLDDHAEGLPVIQHMPLTNVATGETRPIKDLFDGLK